MTTTDRISSISKITPASRQPFGDGLGSSRRVSPTPSPAPASIDPTANHLQVAVLIAMPSRGNKNAHATPSATLGECVIGTTNASFRDF
jgi:hypothetical protein